MKKFLTISILIILVLLIVFAENSLVNNTATDFVAMTKDIENKYIAGEDATNELNILNERWEDRRKTLYFFLLHESIKDVDRQLVPMKILLSNPDNTDTLEKLKMLSHYFREIKANYEFSWVNVF